VCDVRPALRCRSAWLSASLMPLTSRQQSLRRGIRLGDSKVPYASLRNRSGDKIESILCKRNLSSSEWSFGPTGHLLVFRCEWDCHIARATAAPAESARSAVSVCSSATDTPRVPYGVTFNFAHWTPGCRGDKSNTGRDVTKPTKKKSLSSRDWPPRRSLISSIMIYCLTDDYISRGHCRLSLVKTIRIGDQSFEDYFFKRKQPAWECCRRTVGRKFGAVITSEKSLNP